MRKAWLYQCVVAVACCVGTTGCTISHWVTDSRDEVIPDASATTIRPLLEMSPLSQERPELLVKLSKQVEGPLEVQEHKHEQIKTIWGNSLSNVGFAWLALPLSPIALVLDTLSGKPGEGISAVVNSFLAATGFNAMEGSMFHISEKRGESKIDRTPMGNSTRTEPWRFGVVEVKADGQAPVTFQANQTGYVTIDLKKLPSQLSQRSNDLILSISPTEGTVAAAESVTVPVSTMVAWEQKEAARAKLEEENKAQWERDRPAREARERAAQARAAEDERLARLKAAEEARAYQRELAQKREQDAQAARETSEAMGNLLGAFAQMEQNKTDRAQAQYDNQQRLAQAQQEQQRRAQEQRRTAPASNSSSRHQHNPANEATKCISVDTTSPSGVFSYGARFVNTCSFAIEVTWCSNTRSQPNHCNERGFDNLHTFRAGGTYPINAIEKAISWDYAACKQGTMFSMTEMSRRKEFICEDR